MQYSLINEQMLNVVFSHVYSPSFRSDKQPTDATGVLHPMNNNYDIYSIFVYSDLSYESLFLMPKKCIYLNINMT